MAFISIPSKKSYEVDLNKPLKNCLASNYGGDNSTFNAEAVAEEINRMRSNCISKNLDQKHEQSIELLER